MKRQFDVYGLDAPCIDLNLNLKNLPQKNHGALITGLSWQGGGKVSSGLVACARLGGKCAAGGTLELTWMIWCCIKMRQHISVS